MNNYQRLAQDLSVVAANFVELSQLLPFDMETARGINSVQVANDCLVLERMSLRLIDCVFPAKSSAIRSSLESQEDPCVRAARSLQGVFANIGLLDHAVSSWPDSDGLRKIIATILRIATILVEQDLMQMLHARRMEVTERLIAWRQGYLQSTAGNVSEAIPPDPSLNVLASSAEEQMARLEAMWNYTHCARPEVAPATEVPAGKSVPLQKWRRLASMFRNQSG
jgi:hypothetical protein